MEDKNYNLNEAIELLTKGIILTSTINNRQAFIKCKNKIIYIYSFNTRIKINMEDFKTLYDKCVFEIYDENQEITVDLEKDKEYYSWRQ